MFDDMTMEKWNTLEERVTRLVGAIQGLKNENHNLKDQLNQLEQDLHSKVELINQLQSQQDEKQMQLETFQQERDGIHQRIEKMLTGIEEIKLDEAA